MDCVFDTAVVRPGLPLIGADKLRLLLTRGLLDLRPLYECDTSQVVTMVGRLASQDTSAVTALHVGALGRKGLWLWKQLILPSHLYDRNGFAIDETWA